MIEAENPHAAFTLLRAYAENTAAILYAKDHPNRVDHFWDTEGHGVKIGTITNYADKRFEGFKGIYDQLSKFAHPQALGVLASASITDDYTLRWSSAPHFKRPEDQLTAYAWVVELAEGSRHLLYEFAQRYELGYFASGQTIWTLATASRSVGQNASVRKNDKKGLVGAPVPRVWGRSSSEDFWYRGAVLRIAASGVRFRPRERLVVPPAVSDYERMMSAIAATTMAATTRRPSKTPQLVRVMTFPSELGNL
jgi:hypothetical protein